MQETIPETVSNGFQCQCFGGAQTAAAVTALAAAIAEGKTEEELDLLAIIFNMLGDAFGVISAQRALCKTKQPG